MDASSHPSVLPVEAQALCFDAGGRRLLGPLDVAIAAGLCTVIVGPNGAGKSLLLRLLHGLAAPTSGTILWGGQRFERATRLRQAMVFQRPVMLRRSAAANIRHALKSRGLRGKDARTQAADALAVAGLTHLADTPARVLSGGEQQRLAVARALALRPDVLFLDEPSASLDPASTLAIEGLIQSAHLAGTKIILVTHDLGQARRLADEVIFLFGGRIEERAPADQFFADPMTERARAFIAGRIVL